MSSDATKTKLVLLRDEAAGIEAAIAPAKGGELSGLAVRFVENGSKDKWIETLYLARDYSPRQGWTGKAPFLWPATGRNFPEDLRKRREAGERFDGGAYNLKDKRYKMPIHGFARDLPWELESAEAGADGARAELWLTDNDQTREFYPFGFRLTVEYLLANGRLDISYLIHASNENSEAMMFSLGNHITFRTPLVEGSDPAEVVLTTPSTMEILKTGYGVPTSETRQRSHSAGVKLGDFETAGGFADSEAMMFSLGNHITFRTPLVEGSDPAEVVLTTPSTMEILKTGYGVPTSETRQRSHSAGVKLGDFEKLRAVSLTGYPSGEEPYVLLRDPLGLSIRMSHAADDIPKQPVILFNVWGDALGGFISPEPWVGLQNSLVLGKGLTYLEPGEDFRWRIRITPERE